MAEKQGYNYSSSDDSSEDEEYEIMKMPVSIQITIFINRKIILNKFLDQKS